MVDALPSMASLIAFSEAARTLSFKRAARSLHLSPSALSRQIQALEEHLGFVVFERLNPGLALTEAGERYLEVVRRVLDELGRAQRASVPPFDEPLRVSALQSFTERCLVPHLGALARAHPGLTLEIEATLRYADFERDRVDVAIRFGRGPWGDLHAEPLLELDAFALASPTLLTAGPPLREPADLAAHTRIELVQTPEAWPQYLRAAGVPALAPHGVLRFDHAGLAVGAAEAGLGVALMPALLCGPQLAGGRLRRVFELSVRSASTYHFVCRRASLADARVRALRAFLGQVLAQAT